MIKKIVVLFLLVLLISPPLFAGQLHIEYVGLYEVARNSGLAIVMLLNKISSDGKTVTGIIKELYLTKEGKERDFYKKYKKGKEYSWPLYGGVEWSDPGVSPMDMRFYTESFELKDLVGKLVLMVPADMNSDMFEVAPYKGYEKKLEVFFGKNGVEKYLKSLDEKTTISALRDRDLLPLVLKHLTKEKKLTGRLILSACRTLEGDVSCSELAHQFRYADENKKDTASEILKLIPEFYPTSGDPEGKWFYEVTVNLGISEKHIGEIIDLFSKIKNLSEKNREVLTRWLFDFLKRTKDDFSLSEKHQKEVNSIVSNYMAKRDDYFAEEALAYFKKMKSPHKGQLGLEVFKHYETSVVAKTRKNRDDFIWKFFETAIQEDPQVEQIKVLIQEKTAWDDWNQRDVRIRIKSLYDLAQALLKKFPQEKGALEPFIKKVRTIGEGIRAFE